MPNCQLFVGVFFVDFILFPIVPFLCDNPKNG